MGYGILCRIRMACGAGAFRTKRQWLASGIALAVGIGALAGEAQAGGKPEKAFFESKFHMMIPGLRDPDLMSRVVGNELWMEHARDARVIPGLRRYAQNAPLPFHDRRSSFDSVSNIWFDNFEAARAGFASEEMRLGAFVWMSRFTGGPTAGIRPWRPNSKGIVIVRDHVMVDGYEQGYQWLSFMRRKEGVSKEQVDAYMRDKYAPALAKLPGIQRYVIGLTYRPKGADEAGGMWGPQQNYDAVDMIWFDDLDAMQRLLGSIDYQENVQAAAEAAVIDRSHTISYSATYNERIPFPPRYEGPGWDALKPAVNPAKH